MENWLSVGFSICMFLIYKSNSKLAWYAVLTYFDPLAPRVNSVCSSILFLLSSAVFETTCLEAYCSMMGKFVYYVTTIVAIVFINVCIVFQYVCVNIHCNQSR